MKAIEEAKVRIGVAEVPGTSLKRRLQRSDPFKEKYSVTAPIRDPTKPNPTLRAHVDERHSADPSPPKFKMEVTGVYAGDATKRQVSEAVKIRNTAGQMNRQEEWRQIRLPRLGLS